MFLGKCAIGLSILIGKSSFSSRDSPMKVILAQSWFFVESRKLKASEAWRGLDVDPVTFHNLPAVVEFLD